MFGPFTIFFREP